MLKNILIILGIIALCYYLHVGVTVRILGAHFSVGF